MALRLTLLGGIRVLSEAGDTAIVLPTRKARALLAYLACPPGRLHPRDKLAALLWGERGGAQARASLRQELYELRRALAPFDADALRLEADAVALTPESVDVDVLRFERLVREGTPAALEAAATLHQGELLEGLAVDEPAFEEWLRVERERLRGQAAHALARLFEHQRAAGAPEAAIETALRLLAFDPADESLHRAVMRLQLALGRRCAARRQYEACVDALQQEIGVEPEAETRQLHAEILGLAATPGRAQDDRSAERAAPRGVALVPWDESAAESPLVGREGELRRLEARFEATQAGRGGAVFLAGEPGIGKTRLLQAFAARVRAAGGRVLWGRCLEGELAPPFGPFAEAIGSYAWSCDPETLRAELGVFGGIVAKIAPGLRARLPELPAPVALASDEERHRLLDAVTQVLWACARAAPLVLVLDDLHWADGATLALLRHLGRLLARRRVLVVAAYRDVELGRSHPLGETIEALRRAAEVERIRLPGLDREAVAELLERIAKRELPEALVETIAAETAGNPFFVREVVLHLLDEGTLDGATAGLPSRFSAEERGVPEGVRQLIGRRLARLSDEANRLLAAASCCASGVRFDVAARAAGLEEQEGLDALDEALEAQLLRTTAAPVSYEFPHALIRHTLYTELSPSRRARLHRRLAAAMERAYGVRAAEHALEIAEQWHRSAALPGAERGLGHCLAAADHAERAAADAEAARALRMSLDLVPAGDARRPRLVARLGLALAWGGAPAEAVDVASEAGRLLAATEGSDAAAEYLADAAHALYASSFDAGAWALAEQGLRYAAGARDLTWARLAALDFERREANDPEFPGIPLDHPTRREISQVLVANLPTLIQRGLASGMSAMVYASRADALARGGALPAVRLNWAGEYASASALASERASNAVERGRLALAVLDLTVVARAQAALGNLDASLAAFATARDLAERAGSPPYLVLQLQATALGHAAVRGEGYEAFVPVGDRLLAEDLPEHRWAGAAIRAAAALVYAHTGRAEDAGRAIERVLPAIERAAGWAVSYTSILCWAIEALWMLDRCDPPAALERNLREKTLAADFRSPHVDARLALARLCALTSRFEEAREAFGAARRVLEGQGARPLRAVCDFDEAWMELRRGRAGDAARARARLDAASAAFETIGMPGWLRRARALRAQLGR